jgi:hypothetical protein
MVEGLGGDKSLPACNDGLAKRMWRWRMAQPSSCAKRKAETPRPLSERVITFFGSAGVARARHTGDPKIADFLSSLPDGWSGFSN